jgi:hypothetical protein
MINAGREDWQIFKKSGLFKINQMETFLYNLDNLHDIL